MLIEFAIENFRSIKDRQVFSLEPAFSTKIHPQNITSPTAKKQLLASSVIYGPNASGKSNVIKALRAIEYLIVNSSQFKLDDKIAPFEPYKLDIYKKNEPVHLEIVFLNSENIRYHYEIAFTRSEFTYESLFFYPRQKAARVFERKKGSPILYGEYYRGDRKNIENQLLENQLFLSKAANSNVKQLRNVYLFFKQNLSVMPSFYEPVEDELRQYYAGRFSDNQSTQFKRLFNKLINTLDTGITSIEVEELDYTKVTFPESVPEEIQQQIRERYKYEIKTRHKLFEGDTPVGDVEFDIGEESDGTRRLFSVSGIILDALEKGRTLVLDEFEKSLHPHIIRYLVQLFHNPKINKKNAQLIFATHDITQLSSDVFRKDQVWFTQKDTSGATTLYSLADFEGVRNNVPFEKWYTTGKFHAIPHIKELDFELNYDEEEA